ncbi:MAG TPA: Crp/Fnr family transcriptional regulator [Candidatus Dormibacteraeota bacterium]|nr:Crp/Fnr family transcriptional regulator [Candidatus Dormibacteraeota bacterium]
MKGPYGFEMNDNCENCNVKGNGFFCKLSPAATKHFNTIKSTSAYPDGAVLFLEQQASHGVFVLCQGEVKLSISSSEGKTLILRIAKPGEILGLTAVLGNRPYEVSAETLRPSQIAFVRHDDFVRFLTTFPEAMQGLVRQLSSNYRGACEQLRTVALSTTVQEKLAKLLLDWSAGADSSKGSTHIKMPLTHEEIAEFIGSSRETVTRALGDFKQRHLVTLKGSTLTIENREALASFVNAA